MAAVLPWPPGPFFIVAKPSASNLAFLQKMENAFPYSGVIGGF